MSTRICILLGLTAALAIRPAFGSGADDKKFYMVVVAERTDPEATTDRKSVV